MSRGRFIPNAHWPKTYLGDGAYAYFDGHGFWITAENGMFATDAVYLEAQVLDEFTRFVETIRKG